jgi:hypothetical protein
MAFATSVAACGPEALTEPTPGDTDMLGEDRAALTVSDAACVLGTAEVGMSYAPVGAVINTYSNGSLFASLNVPEVYVGGATGCTDFQRHQWGARVTNLAVARANMPAYPNIATVNAANLDLIQQFLPKLTITNGHVVFSQLANLLTNPQCPSYCRTGALNLMSSTAGTAAERATVASNQGLSSTYAGVLNDYGVLLLNRLGSFSANDVAAIREILGLLPFPIVEMIHTITIDTNSGGGSMAAGGDMYTSYHNDSGQGAGIISMPMADGTVIPGLRNFKNVIVHEAGHQVDYNSPEKNWRYNLLYERGKADPMARVGMAGGADPGRSEDFVGFWVTWFFDTRALLTQVQRRNNPVFSCKVAHMADLLSYESTTTVPYYKATATGDLQRLGSLAVTRSNMPLRNGDDGRITAIDGVAINCPRNVMGDVDRDGAADVMLTGASNWPGIPVGFSNRDGTFRLTNSATPSFPASAQVSGAKPVAGDFNNDGRWDLALLGGTGASTIPVAFSKGDGTFNTINANAGNLTTLAQAAGAQPVAGDFNGDGAYDVALTGASGWTSIPVAFFSTGANQFFATNTDPAGSFPTWATVGKAVPGDFNADGKTDIALVGGPGWNTLPVAYSYGGGGFRITNEFIGTYATWATQEGKPVAGDFDGDGQTDIALVGGKNSDGTAWSFVPVAFSNGSLGTFRVTSATIGASFGNLARATGVQAVAGDVNADGRSDIVLAGGPSWAFVVVAFSNGANGTFNVVSSSGGNNTLLNFFAGTANAKMRSSY